MHFFIFLSFSFSLCISLCPSHGNAMVGLAGKNGVHSSHSKSAPTPFHEREFNESDLNIKKKKISHLQREKCKNSIFH